MHTGGVSSHGGGYGGKDPLEVKHQRQKSTVKHTTIDTKRYNRSKTIQSIQNDTIDPKRYNRSKKIQSNQKDTIDTIQYNRYKKIRVIQNNPINPFKSIHPEQFIQNNPSKTIHTK